MQKYCIFESALIYAGRDNVFDNYADSDDLKLITEITLTGVTNFEGLGSLTGLETLTIEEIPPHYHV